MFWQVVTFLFGLYCLSSDLKLIVDFFFSERSLKICIGSCRWFHGVSCLLTRQGSSICCAIGTDDGAACLLLVPFPSSSQAPTQQIPQRCHGSYQWSSPFCVMGKVSLAVPLTDRLHQERLFCWASFVQEEPPVIDTVICVCRGIVVFAVDIVRWWDCHWYNFIAVMIMQCNFFQYDYHCYNYYCYEYCINH